MCYVGGEKTAALRSVRCKAERLEVLHQSYRVLKLMCANCLQALPIHPAAQPLPFLLKKGPNQLATASSPVLCRGHRRRSGALPGRYRRNTGAVRVTSGKKKRSSVERRRREARKRSGIRTPRATALKRRFGRAACEGTWGWECRVRG